MVFIFCDIRRHASLSQKVSYERLTWVVRSENVCSQQFHSDTPLGRSAKARIHFHIQQAMSAALPRYHQKNHRTGFGSPLRNMSYCERVVTHLSFCFYSRSKLPVAGARGLDVRRSYSISKYRAPIRTRQSFHVQAGTPPYYLAVETATAESLPSGDTGAVAIERWGWSSRSLYTRSLPSCKHLTPLRI